MPSTSLMEAMLWLLSIFLLLLFRPLGLILLSFSIGFSIWRLAKSHKACLSCGSYPMIPYSSPMAQKFMAKNESYLERLGPPQRTINWGLVAGSVVGVFIVAGILARIDSSRNRPQYIGSSGTVLNTTTEGLVGQCAYSPSDMNLSGRVIRVGPEGIDVYGNRTPGQRTLAVINPLVGEMKVIYPRWQVMKPCE